MAGPTSKLDTSIEFLKGVGPFRADILKKELQIFTFGDLLQHFPFRYIDRSRFYRVSEINGEEQVIQLRGIIDRFEMAGKSYKKRLKAIFRDESGSLELVWFKGASWIQKSITPGKEYIVFGKVSRYNGKFNMAHPELSPVNEKSEVSGSLQAVYSTTEKCRSKGLDSRGIAKLIKTLLDELRPSDLPENLPDYLLKKYRLPGRWEAMRMIHRPRKASEHHAASRRLKFEELFFHQLKILRLKNRRNLEVKGFVFEKPPQLLTRFYKEVIPFELTGAQKRVLKEIRKDTLSGRQMNRLLQGDVGSGKTMVAFMSMLLALDNGFQAAMMAPTEILARQHFFSVRQYAEPLGLRVGLLTGSVKLSERKKLLSNLAEGQIDILIGTHALLEDPVQFKNLGLVIIDEQHRFGVAQRARLWQKSEKNPPHVLVMTATPIPRTLAMTVFGDLDVSVIDELPPGRKAIQTVHMTDSDRLRIFGFMEKEIATGRQVYVVYPLISESEKLDYKDLEDGYESICRAFPAPKYQVSILHGRMKPEDKDWEMQRFVRGESQIMVATTVIEVGVDVPNASVMVIESAERFGLAQLHQLRGRVGRGADKSYCILVSKHKLSSEARLRMKTMTSTNDGFRIAQVDMDLRGPGAFDTTRQSGHLHFRVADIQKDLPVLIEARKSALHIIENDPGLLKEEHRVLNRLFSSEGGPPNEWSRIL